MRTSYSQSSTYIRCPYHWKWKYKDKIDSTESGASLSFGSAVDEAVRAILEGKDNYLEVFNKKWHSTYNKNQVVPIYDSPNIVYAHSDFDEHVLDDIDKETLKRWLKELEINPKRLGTDGVKAYKEAAKIKKNPFKQLSEKELQYFNRASWLSLRNKGRILLAAFVEQFVPKIKKVLAIQQPAYIKDEVTGDGIQGFIDMVVEIQGYDKPIIFDLKTSQRPYDDENIELTEQLSLYLAMKGAEYNTNLVGYVVLTKQIEKEYNNYCSVCGKKKTTRAKTCDAKINGTRCNGAWVEKVELKPKVQIFVKEKTQEEIGAVLMDQGNIISAMKQEIVFKNRDLCSSWFGSPCPYKKLCYNSDMTGLKKRGE